jgi:streptogramin lyase
MKITVAGLCLFCAFSLRAQDSVTTLAGQPLLIGATNGPGATALFNDPAGLVADTAGSLFIADSRNHVIRKITTNSFVTTFAGQAGTPGTSDGTGSARFDTPSGIALAPNGDFYVSDTGNHTIRKITPAGAVTTIAGGAGQSGFTNALRTAARFNSPLGIAAAADGTIFVADTGNHLVRVMAPDGMVTTLAGHAENWGTQDGAGGNARFNGPLGVAVDAAGDVFVSDSNNHTIRKVTRAGIVTTWAGAPGVDGSADGNRFTARFAHPAELAFDKHGNLFVADSFNHLIRKISPDGNVSTVTGRADADGSADGSNGDARLFNPYGLAVRPDGSLVVADAYNELIRLVFVPFSLQIRLSSPGTLISCPTVIGKKYQAQYQTGLGVQSWVNLGGPLTATHLNTSFAMGEPSGRGFFRVILLP